VVAHGLGETLKALGSLLAGPSNGCGDQRHPEEIRHCLGQAFLGQRLLLQQIEHAGGDPRAVLQPAR